MRLIECDRCHKRFNKDAKKTGYVNLDLRDIGSGAMTQAQWLYMRQQQLKWIRPQLVACMLITLRRKYGFGFERCSRIYQQISDIEAEYRANPERLRKACYEMTGIDVAATVTTDRRETA